MLGRWQSRLSSQPALTLTNISAMSVAGSRGRGQEGVITAGDGAPSVESIRGAVGEV